MNPKVDQYKPFVNFIGANRPSYFLILHAEQRKKYVMETEPTVENFQAFVEGFRQG